jgi:hypothetical protein
MSGTGAASGVPMEGILPEPQIPDPAAAAAQLQQQIDQQAAELERLRKEKADREQADLAAQLQRQTILQPERPISGKVDGALAPQPWDPKNVSWQQYATTLCIYMVAALIPQAQWGMRALTFLPAAAQQAFMQYIKLPLTELTAARVTWDVVSDFCTQHQVAHLDTNFALRETLYCKIKQYDAKTGITVSLADHIAKLEAFFLKCSEKPDPASQVFAVLHSLHPALREHCSRDPATNQEFLTYEPLRNYLVNFSSHADRLIAAWERRERGNGKGKQQQHQQRTGNTSTAATKSIGVTGGVRKPKGYGNWTPAQKELHTAGKCVHCEKDWAPGHRCLNKKNVPRYVLLQLYLRFLSITTLTQPL